MVSINRDMVELSDSKIAASGKNSPDFCIVAGFLAIVGPVSLEINTRGTKQYHSEFVCFSLLSPNSFLISFWISRKIQFDRLRPSRSASFLARFLRSDSTRMLMIFSFAISNWEMRIDRLNLL